MDPTETSHEGALDAINEALGLTGDEAHTEEVDDEIEGAEGDDAAGEGDDAGEGEGDGEGEGEGDGDTRSEEEKLAAAKTAGKTGERNPDGTFKKPGEAKKAADPLNDPIPKDLKKETSERMQSLIKIAKDVTTERDNYRTNFDTIINGIKASGASPEQYGELISWASLFNSPEPQARMKAYELVNDVAERMATMLGVDRTVRDPLANHPDLKAAVTAGKATPEMAREVARTRDARAFTGQIQDGQRQQQQTQQQAEQEYAQARTDLNAFEAQMKVSDPLYARKREAIVPIMQEAFKTIPKAKWAETFKAAYARVKVQPTGRTQTNQQQPLRGGKNPAGGQSRVAGSALDAMNGALSSMNK
jgi:hypothetical protein